MEDRQDIRVLIAEDDYLTGEMIKEMLKEVGYTVIGKAVDGLQAVEMTESAQPDVILMDIEMPDMDGIEATRLIQKHRPTPVVMLTAYEKEELVAEAGAAGAGAYLVKPLNVREMARAITIAMARFDDMMALRRSNRRLEEALAELEATQQQVVRQERLAAVGQLAAGIAHEFNNIMASVILYSDMMLRSSDLLPKDREQLIAIRQQGRRAASLTQQILDFSGKAMLRRQVLDLCSFMEGLISILQRTLPESINIHLSHSAEEVMVNADPDRLQQAVMNLALNARDAMPEGGDFYLRLTRFCLEHGEPAPSREMGPGEWACLAVTDTGSGIPTDVLPHLFEPFFTTRVPLRTGLGLAQVYGITKQHDGHIDVSTQAGHGTTFTIYLPALPVSEPEARFSEVTAMPEGDGETILVVEDGPAIRKALAESLEMLNYRVLTAASGREALALFEQHSGDPSTGSGPGIALVLSDLVMPEIGGIALCRALKRHDPDVRVVILTGYPLEYGEEGWESAGVVGWVRKPVDLDQLAQVMARTLKVLPDESQ
jgi:two-component system cell cycle sensor histidine kinase/response regulator CckA